MSETETPTPVVDENTDAEAVKDELGALAEELEVVRAENQRLRRAFDRARQVTNRRAAVDLGVVGIVGLAAAVLLPSLRTVLLVLGAIGVYSSLLTYFLTPERFVPATVGEHVYVALAESRSSLVEELGLSDACVYVPRAEGASIRLFVPRYADAPLPAADDLSSTLVVTESSATRGMAFHPSGAGLYREYEDLRANPAAQSPVEAADGLAEAVVEAFELARSATTDVNLGEGRASVEVRGSAYGRLDRFDHPVVSFIGIGLADARGTPVSVEEVIVEDAGEAGVVTYSWESSG